MRDIELQSEYIIARNLVPEPAVRQASQDAQESGSDLLTVLVASGQLEDSLADQIRQPNALGLVDTLGNVWEVCTDAYTGYRSNPPVDHLPRGSAETKFRTKRGGGFLYGGPVDSRCSIRGANEQDVTRWALGFRVVRSLVTEESIRPKNK